VTNVLLVLVDDLPQGGWTKIPYLRDVLASGMVRFTRAVNTTPLCGPSRNTAWTGRYAWNHGADTNPLNDSQVNGGVPVDDMLAVWLQDAGWSTGHAGKYNNGYPWFALTGDRAWQPPGWTEFHAKAGGAFYDWTAVDNGVRRSGIREYITDYEADRVAGMVSTLPQPWFVQWSASAPHSLGHAFIPAARHAEVDVGSVVHSPAYNETDVGDKPRWLREKYPHRLSQATCNSYDARLRDCWRMLRALSEGLQQVVDALVARGVRGNTMIMFATDNSNTFGDHRHISKGLPYQCSLDMQLLIGHPDIAPRIEHRLVGNIDLAPTILDIAGARPTVAPDGMTMLPLLHQQGEWRRQIVFGKGNETPRQYGPGDYRGLLTDDGWKYVHHLTDGDVELYDLSADPWELSNIAADQPAKRSQLAADLARHRTAEATAL
jgi:N-acetylglucosamine-6-sulfatase